MVEHCPGIVTQGPECHVAAVTLAVPLAGIVEPDDTMALLRQEASKLPLAVVVGSEVAENGATDQDAGSGLGRSGRPAIQEPPGGRHVLKPFFDARGSINPHR
jgi:hypothetical protein